MGWESSSVTIVRQNDVKEQVNTDGLIRSPFHMHIEHVGIA